VSPEISVPTIRQNVTTPSSGKKNFCQTTRLHMQEDHYLNIVPSVTLTNTVDPPPPFPSLMTYSYSLSLSRSLTGKVVKLDVFVRQYGKLRF
jgi:hypothetical protein